MRWRNGWMNKAIIIDTETSGFTEPDVIELAYSAPIEERHYHAIAPVCFTHRFMPTKAMDLGARAAHLITLGDLKGFPVWPGYWLQPPGTDYLIGHNIDFDWEALGKPKAKRICTLALARHTWPTIDSHSLGALMFHLFPEEDARAFVLRAHSAMADVVMCWALLCQLLIVHFPEKFTWELVWLKSEIARVPSHMAFGKHRGMLIKDVPADYKRWLLKQDDVDPYLRKALTQ